MTVKQCNYCVRKINAQYINCIDCNVELCIKCYCYGLELGKHNKTHKYQIKNVIVGNNVFKIHSKWELEEESKFLNCLSIYKTGNWYDFAQNINNRNADECYKHFVDVYLNSPMIKELNKHLYKSGTLFQSSIYDHTGGLNMPELYEEYNEVLIKHDQEKLIGYNPQRNDFIIESSNSAEQLVSPIQPQLYSEKYEKLNKSLYSNMVSMYQQKLTSRANIKKTIRQHNIIPHLLGNILGKPPRDLNYFQRQSNKTMCDLNVSIQSRSRRQDCNTENNAAISHPSWNYNVTHLPNEFKPLLKLFNENSLNQLVEGLRHEHTIKSEINALKYCVHNQILSHKDYKAMQPKDCDISTADVSISVPRKKYRKRKTICYRPCSNLGNKTKKARKSANQSIDEQKNI